ncbi:MAG: helix-turn-helix domain-containing protein [Hyphomicrobiales bacterium]|nr:helix-turn-helix domain-containing protein [Hyphomicrobiales bacterium]
MTSYVPVNSVVRALNLLRELNRSSVTTLDQLHIHTKIPKSSIIRLLQTFEAQNIVQKAPQHGAYCLTPNVLDFSSIYNTEPDLVKASADITGEVTRDIRWPLAVAAPQGSRMVVRYNTMPATAFSLLHTGIGAKLNMVSRAMGNAYLAYCDEGRRKELLDQAKSSSDPEDALSHDRKAVTLLLAEVRKQGIATRDSYGHPAVNTLAAPVFRNRAVVATVGMAYLRADLETDAAIARFKPVLLDLAKQIGANLEQSAQEK